jgi:uncharacterized protein YjbI with pentapeptide repeats
MENGDTAAQTRRTTSWKERRMGVRCTWWVPFAFAEWFCERLSDRLDRWAFLDVLERVGHLAILVAVVFYIVEAPERRKGNQYYAWQIINSLKGSRTDGGRKYAIQDLLRDGVSLAGIDLTDAILPNVDFKNADLRQGRFWRAELLDADFQRAVLSGSRFNESLLNRANFSEARLKNVEFGEACLEDANFSHADLEEANFYNAKLRNAAFTDSNLSGAKLERADLTGAAFVDANLCAARLGQADVAGVDFSRANLRRVRLTACVHWKDIKNVRLANIIGMPEPPPGFLEWAREHGAVEIEDDLEWKRLIDQERRKGGGRWRR